MFGSAYALHHHSHLLLAEKVCSGLYVGPAAVVEDRGIDTLDGLSKHTQHLVPVLDKRDHICRIYARERLVAAVLELRARTHSQR